MVSARFDLFGPAQSTVGYTTTGEADDWLYGKMGIISMTPEVHENCLAHIWSSVVKFKGNLSKRRNPLYGRYYRVLHSVGNIEFS